MPGDILLCSLPHLIALPCQTRAERAKAPSPVPRSISWQSFESNCDCSALRSSEQQLLYLPTRPASSCSCPALFGSTLAPCLSAPAWPRLSLSLLTDLVSRLSLSRSLSPSGPPLARLQSPVSGLQFPVSRLLLPGSPTAQSPFFLPLTSSRPGLLDYILAQPAPDVKAELLRSALPSSSTTSSPIPPPSLHYPFRHGTLSSSE